MHYLIGRDIDGDGYPEFVQNLDTMALTEDPHRALQFTTAELAYIDMPYLNSLGFYAIEAPNYGVALLTNLLFRPTVRSYRPRVAPPPRRPRPARPVPPPPPYHMGPGYPHPTPRGPIGPGPRGPMGGPLGGPMGGPGRGPGGRGGRGPGGMGGPGRGPGGFGY